MIAICNQFSGTCSGQSGRTGLLKITKKGKTGWPGYRDDPPVSRTLMNGHVTYPISDYGLMRATFGNFRVLNNYFTFLPD
jgi:hypothetical protein